MHDRQDSGIDRRTAVGLGKATRAMHSPKLGLRLVMVTLVKPWLWVGLGRFGYDLIIQTI